MDLVMIAGSMTTAAASGSTIAEHVAAAALHAVAQRVWPAPAEKAAPAPGTAVEQRIDRGAGHVVGDAGLPGDDHRLDVGGEDDMRRLGVGVDVELGRRRGVAAAIDGAAHDGELADAIDDRRVEPQRQRQIGQRPDHQDIDLFALGGGGAEGFDQHADGIVAGRLGAASPAAARRPGRLRHGYIWHR